MASVNKVIIIGNLGKDPDAKYSQSGKAITIISVATKERWEKNGQSNEHTEWHRVVFFNRLAEVVAEYLRKGSSIYVEGQLKTRKWQDQNGQDRYSTEIIGRSMQMLDNRQDQQQRPQQPQQQRAPQQQRRQQPQQRQAPPPPDNFDMYDDDIPF